MKRSSFVCFQVVGLTQRDFIVCSLDIMEFGHKLFFFFLLDDRRLIR